MSVPASTRIQSLDFLKGLVMVIMALDHVRDYFHADAFLYDPSDPAQSNLAVFLTRWITHFCAPAFSFLAGTSAFLVGRRKTKAQLSRFLLTRGLWLVFIELTVVTFAWFFDFQFRAIGLLVIWSLGMSMVFLAAMIHLPWKILLAFCLVLIFGHNLLDGIGAQSPGLLWSILHVQNFIPFGSERVLLIGYPLIPWMGVMGLGYCFGRLFDPGVVADNRRKAMLRIGLAALAMFVLLRATGLYGDPEYFVRQPTLVQDLILFFDPTKYPPSLQYLLMTIGGLLVILAFAERWTGKVVDYFSTFGRVPFFYYILHLYLIHLLAMAATQWTGFGWDAMVLTTWIGFEEKLQGYGFGLWVVHAVWVGIILVLYPLCRRFDRYKQAHQEKWWLSYL